MSGKQTLFLIGATGYIGGEILAQLQSFEIPFEITALVRSQEQADKLASALPSVRTVLGDLNSHELLVKESSNADVIIQSADCDHVEVILSIIEGARKSNRTRPLVIQVSGTGSLVDMDILGKKPEKVVSDRDDYQEILDLPETRFHIPVEKKFIPIADEAGLRVAILAPGIIFGKSRGLFRTENRFLAMGFGEFIKHESVLMLEDGAATWGWVSVGDVASAILFAVKEGLKDNTRLQFGSKGYYFIGTGEASMKERLEFAAETLFRQGKIKSDKIKSYNLEEIQKLSSDPFFTIWLGSSSRYRADRLRDLGWAPKELDWKTLMASTESF
jgi:nucleoside-diphosphate-sugar epimerase